MVIGIAQPGPQRDSNPWHMACWSPASLPRYRGFPKLSGCAEPGTDQGRKDMGRSRLRTPIAAAASTSGPPALVARFRGFIGLRRLRPSWPVSAPGLDRLDPPPEGRGGAGALAASGCCWVPPPDPVAPRFNDSRLWPCGQLLNGCGLAREPGPQVCGPLWQHREIQGVPSESGL